MAFIIYIKHTPLEKQVWAPQNIPVPPKLKLLMENFMTLSKFGFEHLKAPQSALLELKLLMENFDSVFYKIGLTQIYKRMSCTCILLKVKPRIKGFSGHFVLLWNTLLAVCEVPYFQICESCFGSDLVLFYILL